MKIPDLKFNADNLYREETYTDLQSGSIRCLIPVKADGSDDPSRSAEFAVQTQVMTQGGALPVSGHIDAATLKEATEKFPEAVEEAIENMVKAAQEYQREEASRIVVPGQKETGGLIV